MPALASALFFLGLSQARGIGTQRLRFVANGGGDGSWDGKPTTFTFTTSKDPVTTPEPTTVSLLLLGIGVLGLLYTASKGLIL
jgi:hypothetical protein